MIVKEFEINAINLPNAIKMFFVQKFNIQYNIYHVLISTILQLQGCVIQFFSMFRLLPSQRKESKHSKIQRITNGSSGETSY